MSIRIIRRDGKIRYEIPGRILNEQNIDVRNEEFLISNDDTSITLTLSRTPMINSETITINGLILNQSEYTVDNNLIHVIYPITEGDLIKIKYF